MSQPQQNITTLHPFLTLKPTTLSLQPHPVFQHYLTKKQLYHIISIIQVKNRDYKLFGINIKPQSAHGLYISQPLNTTTAVDGKQVVYLLLPVNQSKIGQKYQDLFAYIALILSNVCIFDISSKYLRQGRSLQHTQQRNNFVVMNSHTNGSQLYKASITTNNNNNKMQISTKLSPEYHNIIKQLTQNLESKHNLQQIQKGLKYILQRQVLYKNYTNFQQLQYRFHAYIRLYEHLYNNTQQYAQIFGNKQMLTLSQLHTLQYQINKYTTNQLTTNQQIQIMLQIKKQLIQAINVSNTGMMDRLFIQLKNSYFFNVMSYQELSDKKGVIQTILQQYGINRQYSIMVCGQAQIHLQNKQKKQLQQTIQNQINSISQLQQNLNSQITKRQQNEKLLKNYQQKFLNFRQLNTKYIQKCAQLERQRHCTIKNRSQIQTLMIQQNRHQSIQQNLYNMITELKEQKNGFQLTIAMLQSEINIKQQKIKQLENTIALYEDKIKGYLNIQGQAWKCIQDTQQARDQLKRYKDLVSKLQGHCQAYKKMEIQKFNYILQRNAQAYNKVKRQLEQKNSIVESLKIKIQQLEGLVEEQRSRLRYCQQLRGSQSKINSTKNDIQSKTSLENDVNYMAKSNKSWIAT